MNGGRHRNYLLGTTTSLFYNSLPSQQGALHQSRVFRVRFCTGKPNARITPFKSGALKAGKQNDTGGWARRRKTAFGVDS